ncbi:MAG: DUF1653 domain-containing protein [Sediminibacterium sp.]|nr:DUF1653 domain-containing protein [Sediminibacterium sp.]
MEPGIYRHYKGKLYEVLNVATHTETGERLVVYKALYISEGDNCWVRPLSMFNEMVLVDGVSIKRFTKV